MTTVFVLDEGFMSGAYTAVGLRDAGCRVIVLAGVGGRGRCEGRCITWSLGPAVSDPKFLDACDDIVRRSRVDVVYPVTEPIQRVLWDANPDWSDRIFPQSESWQRALLRSKSRIADYVRAHGIPIPSWHQVRDAHDIHDSIAAFRLPVVVKGVHGRGGSETWIVESAADAIDAVQRARAIGVECVLQRYIRGATYLVGGLFDRGRAVRLYAGEKVEQYPARTGPSTRIRSIDDPALLDSALQVFRAAAITGLASADFIRDDDGLEGAAGRYLFLELNPRPWGSVSAAFDAGVDLFAPLAELLRGRLPEADLRFRTGVESRVFPLYLRSSEFWHRHGRWRSLRHDLEGIQGVPWRTAGQAAHLVNRLYRVARNWPRS